MIEQQKDSNKIQVQNFGLVEWLKDVQEAIQADYEFDFETNEGYPQVIGTVYTCLMQPRENKEAEKQSEPEVYPGGSPDTPDMTSKSTNLVLPDKQAEAEPVLPTDEAVAILATTVAKQETDQPTKRAYVSKGNGTGPKPKQ